MMFLITLALTMLTSYATAQASATSQPIPSSTAIAGNYSGLYRPQIHFTAPEGFINDPNGLFRDAESTWHLYYQYNPTDTIAGNQHWGHATSKDLYHWTNQPIALCPYDNVTGIFTGSAVIDTNNTSGLFPNQSNGVVAIYTANSDTDQNQALAYSRDNGYTWQQYSYNPVLAIGSNQFRDPKVFWHAPTQKWIMAVAFAQAFTIGIYTSPNLTTWTHTSNFTHMGLLGLQYECPNLLPIPFIPTTPTGTLLPTQSTLLWLLYISINPGAPLGGSIGQYFIGTFNGTHFTPSSTAARIADFGKDNYAAQFWDTQTLPEGWEQEGVVSIAWASNWQYTNYVPSGPSEGWQSAMTVPRRNYVTNSKAVRDELVLVSEPWNLGSVGGAVLGANGSLGNGTLVARSSGLEGSAGTFLVQVNVTGLNATVLPNTASLNFTVSSAETGERISCGQNFGGGDAEFWMNRGETNGFDNVFYTDKVSTGLVLDDRWDLTMIVDRSVWEVFLMGGQRSGTQTFYSRGVLDMVTVVATDLNEEAQVSVTVKELKSTWADQENGMGVVTGNDTMMMKGRSGFWT